MLERLFPRQIDNRHPGRRAALWLLGAYLALKLLISVNSILNAEAVATGADGFRLETYGADGARAVLMLFALTALGQLALTLLGCLALVRYRAMVPMVFLLLLAEHGARRLIIGSYAVERGEGLGAAFYINAALLAVLALGLALSLWPPRAPPAER
jgi:hypothetical protein